MTISKTPRDTDEKKTSIVLLTLAASLIYGVSSGIRANYGILLDPISRASGVNYASVSFVLAAAQLSFGVMQPVFGVLAMKKSSAFVLRWGSLLMFAGLLWLPFCKSFWTLLIALGLLLPAGTAALAFGIVMSALAPKLPRSSSSAASGIVTASAGVGSTVFAPAMQALAAAAGLFGTMIFLSIPALLLFPVSLYLCHPVSGAVPEEKHDEPSKLAPLVREAVRSRDYIFLLAGFFTCGFHMAIIETHFYTQIIACDFPERIAALALSVYGIAAMAGAVISGGLCGRFAMKTVLAGLYASRVIIVLAFLLLPKTLVTVFGFAVLLGLTGSATVPPTSGLTERLFGAVKLGTLFGVVFFSHQIGSFLSAWLRGVCRIATGGYTLIWLADALLSVLAAAVSFNIQDGREGTSPS